MLTALWLYLASLMVSVGGSMVGMRCTQMRAPDGTRYCVCQTK